MCSGAYRPTPPRPKSQVFFQQKVIRDSNPDLWINPDPDVRVLDFFQNVADWIHYLAGISHFAKF